MLTALWAHVDLLWADDPRGDTMQIGLKAQGQMAGYKEAVHRHTSTFSKASAHRCEKSFESKVRQAGRKACYVL